VTIKKIKSLDSLPVSSSGLDELNQEFSRELACEKYLKQLINGDNEALNNFFQENPHLVDSIKTKAVFLLNLILLGQEVKPYHISVTGLKPKLADDSAWELVNLLKNLEQEISFDFYELRGVMPTIVIYYSDFLLKENFFKTKNTDILVSVKAVIEDDSCFDDLIDENLIAQKYRLRALYHRRLADYEPQAKLSSHEEAERNILLYRKKFQPDLSKKIILNKLSFEAKQPHLVPAPEEDFFEKIYKEAAELQEEVLIRSGVYKDTCFYFQCSDCCKKDFPTVSLAEFLYIKNSLNKSELDKLISKAELIQQAHEKQYGTRLGIVDQTLAGRQKENPNNFQFTCPFLDDKDSCTIHEKRPLACRTFGLSTIDSESVQACKFYLTQYQYNNSHKNERDVYDSDYHTKLIGERNEALAEQHGFVDMKQPVATLVAWLTTV
jgi:Fe-S-cluster containining protein